nr:hypothetical protein B0A51_08797 [Rachicladosporium sp. CCFEE 5018]
MEHTAMSLLKSRSLRRKAPRERDSDELEEILPNRPVKQVYVFTQVVRDDSSVPVPRSLGSDVPQRQPTQRHTWPTSHKERKPGTYQFSEAPTLTKTPWELDRHRARPQSQRSHNGTATRRLPAHVFEQLPTEIYTCILAHLEAAHHKDSVVYVDSRRRDLRNLCLTSKRWAMVAMVSLYGDLWLPLPTVGSKRMLSLARTKGTLELLLRTLTDAPDLAFLVRRLHATSLYDSAHGFRNPSAPMSQTLEQVIERCTELESLSGCTFPSQTVRVGYYAKLLQRPRLREHVWLIHSRSASILNSSGLMDCHNNWQWLETLVLVHGVVSEGEVGIGAVAAIIARLCSLKHLSVSGFSRDDFHDGTLVSLPPLQSLRLERLPGVTCDGLEQLRNSRAAQGLRNLTLVDLNLYSLRTMQVLFANLPQLRRFRLQQNDSPALLAGTSYTSKRALLASQTLQYLHWDCVHPGVAIDVLAKSIAGGNLPSLQAIRAPSDYDGKLQALCRPIEHHAISADDLAYLAAEDERSYSRSLRLSRLQAQRRVRESRAQPAFNVVIENQDEQSQQTHVIGSFLGDMQSKIEYLLEPDVRDSDCALASWPDVATSRRVGGGELTVPLSVLF